MLFPKKLILLVYIILLQYLTESRIILPTFSWDPRNEIFSGSKCGGQPYAHIAVPLDSEMYFVCPSVVMLSKLQIGYVSKTNMYENMYMVTKKQFDECNITEVDGEKTKRVMLCDSPKNPNKLTFNRFFFTSLTTQIAFLPNTTYYFIATSNGQESSLDNLAGGRCKDNNMKLAITVCESGQKCEQNKDLCAVPKAPSTTPTTTTTVRTTTTTETKTLPVVTPKSAQQSAGGNKKNRKTDEKHFGVVAVISLIGGLLFGLIIGVVAVFVVQKYAKRYNEKKSSQNENEVFNIDRKQNSNINVGYRDSKEIKRLLSTSSNNSNERYSLLPYISQPTRVQAPAGSIQV